MARSFYREDVIDLSRPVRAARPLRRPPSYAFVLTLALVTTAASYAVSHPPVTVHTVRVGVSAYPATATASWRDAASVDHPLDPWSGATYRVPARSVVLVVAAPVQCSLVVDGHTVDARSAPNGFSVCQWSA